MITELEIHTESLLLCVLEGDATLHLPVRPIASFHYILHGQGKIEFSDRRTIDVEAGSLVFLPANFGHTIYSDGGGEALPPTTDMLAACIEKIQVSGNGDGGVMGLCGTLNVHVQGARALFDFLISPIVVDARLSRYCNKLMDMVLAEANRGEVASIAIINALIRTCLISITEHSLEMGDAKMGWLAAANQPTLWPALQALMERPADRHTVSSLAMLAGMSRARFAKLFRKTYGRGPIDFLNQLRMQQAMHLLASTNYPVKQVASKVGFESRSAFARGFKDYAGLSPTDYRTQHQQVKAKQEDVSHGVQRRPHHGMG